MQLAPVSTTRPVSSGNPWNFPPLDHAVAERAVAGLDAARRIADHLIDRAVTVRVQLDTDIKAGVFRPDTAHAVELLARAARSASASLGERYLARDVVDPVTEWIRSSTDKRVAPVYGAISDARNAVADFLDDDEGNVRELIRDLRTQPGIAVWRSVRESIDYAMGSMYELRPGLRDAVHVLRAAGGLG